MGRSNQSARRRNAKGRLNRREKGEGRAIPTRIARRARSIEDVILPVGQCFRNPRFPKAKFANEKDAAKALRHAQEDHAHKSSGRVEKRYYLCHEILGKREDGTDIIVGCGGYHLTSRESYENKWKRTP